MHTHGQWQKPQHSYTVSLPLTARAQTWRRKETGKNNRLEDGVEERGKKTGKQTFGDNKLNGAGKGEADIASHPFFERIPALLHCCLSPRQLSFRRADEGAMGEWRFDVQDWKKKLQGSRWIEARIMEGRINNRLQWSKYFHSCCSFFFRPLRQIQTKALIWPLCSVQMSRSLNKVWLLSIVKVTTELRGN